MHRAYNIYCKAIPMYTYIYFKDPIWSFEAILSSDIAKEATDSML